MRIIFPPPGFFVNDPRLTIHVNGWCAYAGSFRTGLDVGFPAVPGALTIVTRIDVLGLGREKVYSLLATERRALELTLEYSRFWGNFAASPRVRFVPLAPQPAYR